MAPVSGYWGELTATIDWCEENYVVNYYVAEFWNTLSNAFIIFSPLAMVVLGLRQKHETRFVCTFAAMTVVGIGSLLFHMTLRYPMQLMDELPMLWSCMSFIYSCLTVKNKINEENRTLQVVLFLIVSAMTVTYLLVTVPVFLQVSYGLLNSFLLLTHIKMIYTMKCEWKLFSVALAFYMFGFLLWNIDNLYCHELRSLRKHKFSRSTGMLFEFHAWWHVFTGVGAYMGILFSLHARYTYLQQKPQLKHFLGFWPYVSLPSEAGKIY